MSTDSTSSFWSLVGSRAVLTSNALSGVLELDSPSRGLHDLRLHGASVDGRLFGLTLDSVAATPWRPADAFVRGRDLIAAYRRTDDEPFAVKVYWRLVAADCDGAILDAIVSLETRSWEAYPQIVVSSALGGACDSSGEGAPLLWRFAQDRSYGEGAREGDFAGPAGPSNSQGLTASAWRFADEFMERGVIRRLHLRGVFMPRAGDEAAAASIPRQLHAEPPPLTA